MRKVYGDSIDCHESFVLESIASSLHGDSVNELRSIALIRLAHSMEHVGSGGLVHSYTAPGCAL